MNMNTLLRMTCTASLVALAGATTAYASEGTTAARVGLEHEAALQSGEHLTVLERKTPESMRVCIRQLPGDVRLRVVHDGEVTEVLDGTCETITARHISVALDSKLPAGDELELKFRAVKG